MTPSGIFIDNEIPKIKMFTIIMNGETCDIFLDGTATGFPKDTVIVNHSLPLFNGILGIIRTGFDNFQELLDLSQK